jgi:hypothetical protein
VCSVVCVVSCVYQSISQFVEARTIHFIGQLVLTPLSFSLFNLTFFLIALCIAPNRGKKKKKKAFPPSSADADGGGGGGGGGGASASADSPSAVPRAVFSDEPHRFAALKLTTEVLQYGMNAPPCCGCACDVWCCGVCDLMVQ